EFEGEVRGEAEVLGLEDEAHAATAKDAQNPIMCDGFTDAGGRGCSGTSGERHSIGDNAAGDVPRRFLEEAVRLAIPCEQAFHFATKFVIGDAGFRKKRGPPVVRDFQSCVENALNQLPTVLLHLGQEVSSLSSQALASFQSRRTVS